MLEFVLGKTIENQEGLLDGDCVGSLLGVMLGILIRNSEGKNDGNKLGC